MTFFRFGGTRRDRRFAMYGRTAAGSLLFFAATTASAFAANTGTVAGTLLHDNAPVSGTTVTLRGENTVQRALTDARGGFVFPRVVFGNYTLDARAADTSAASPVHVDANSISTITLALSPMREIGSVTAPPVLAKGVASSPVAVNTLSRAQIAVMPQNQSLNRLINTLPGFAQFAYDEPVAHGFHGLAYEIDGIPVPQGTAANLSQIIDPRTIDSLEVYTGAIPAEFGGRRQGAVVNITSVRPGKLERPESGSVTVGAGTYGGAQTSISEAAQISGNTQLYFNGIVERTNRGLDSPTFDPLHDRSNKTNTFLRTVTELPHNTNINFNYAENTAQFQVPINTDPNDPNDPVSSPASTADVQKEQSRLLSVAITKSAADGRSYTRIAPWYRYDRIRYLGDSDNDLASVVRDDDGGTTPLNSLQQDRRSEFTGLRVEHFHLTGQHALKAGVDSAVENFHGRELIRYDDGSGTVQSFNDDADQRGTTLGAYIQDKWLPTKYVSIFGGLRYDRSTGYVSAAQLSPRLEINGRVGEKDILHAYYGRQYAAPFLEDTRRSAVILSGGGASALPAYDLKPERDSYYEIGLQHMFSPLVRSYINFFKRDSTNILDTTSLAQSPIQAVFNNFIGVTKGIEMRVEAKNRSGDSAMISATIAQARAAGVNGGTFLFCPPGSDASCTDGNNDLTLAPEDHDQTVAIKAILTKRLGTDRSYFASLAPEYGTGFPVEFQGGEGRLPAHLTFDVALGREAGVGADGHLGYNLTIGNLLNRQYLIKANNGFNTTQWASGFRADLRVTKPF